MRFLFAALLSLVTTVAVAQTYPDHVSTTVNDYGLLISPEAEARITAELSALRQETDVEMVVLTMARQAPFGAGQSVKEFTQGVFDQWGIGDKDTNNGILVLVLQADREMRIELGRGYNNEWNRAAGRIVDNDFLPAFRENNYEGGIEAGVSEIINGIARPFAAGLEAPSSGGGLSAWWLALIALPLGLMMFMRRIKDKLASMRACPSCGKKYLSISREVTEKATKTSKGHGSRTTRCSSCSYINAVPYSIGMLGSSTTSSSGSSSGFGGGSSGGGGASGSW